MINRTMGGNWIRPAWVVYIFGGTCRMPKHQGGGYQWAPNLYRRTRKYYKEGWQIKYSLRDWLSLNRI